MKDSSTSSISRNSLKYVIHKRILSQKARYQIERIVHLRQDSTSRLN